MINKKTHDYFENKFQYDDAPSPINIQNPLMINPINAIINAYCLYLSELFIINVSIIAIRHNIAKIMNKNKSVQPLIISPQNILSIVPNIGTRNTPEKPIIEITRIILLFKLCFSSIISSCNILILYKKLFSGGFSN